MNLTAQQRDTETLAKRCRRITKHNRKENKIEEKETPLSEFTSKTTNYNKFKAFIQKKREIDDATKDFYLYPLYRKMTWRKKTYRQRSDDRFLNRIEETYGKDAIICIGDWSNKNTIKGLASSMGIGLKRLIAKRFKTLLIDEYNTSKLCSECLNETEIVKVKGMKKIFNSETKTIDLEEVDSGVRILGCEYCCEQFRKARNVVCCKHEKSILSKYKLITRDKNSCRNMLNIAEELIKGNGRIKNFTRKEDE